MGPRSTEEIPVQSRGQPVYQIVTELDFLRPVDASSRTCQDAQSVEVIVDSRARADYLEPRGRNIRGKGKHSWPIRSEGPVDEIGSLTAPLVYATASMERRLA